ncbi:uncharacterized protein LOC118196672, partial [Stegodyphus dumicola]|uniref:uncharacterized protein LOC118196672 n=1 Tax=Stegodyphus dumicola TaxID=202533 RepID=UPI0015A8750F
MVKLAIARFCRAPFHDVQYQVNALPSTPEVLEDNGKSFQMLDISELQKSFSEISSSSVSETTSVFSGEKKASQISSSLCYNESLQVTSETIIHEERSLLDSSFQSLKINSENDQEWHVKETPNKLNKDTVTALEVQEDKTDDINSVESDSFSCTNKSTCEAPCDLMQNLEEKHTATSKNDSFRLSKSNFEESSKNEFLHAEDCTLTRNEPVLSVSSLVKSIERSNSFKTAEKVRSSLEESKHLFTKNYAHQLIDFSSEKKTVTNAETIEMKSKCDTLMEDILVSSSEIANKHENISPSQELNGQRLMASQEFISETFKKTVTENLDIESEFVLKPPRKEAKLESDLESVSKENIADEGHKENSVISSRNFEEESIMSSKSVSMGIEESRIFVSHHTTFNDDLKDILVTEAHNFAAVEEKSGVSVQTCSDAGIKNVEKASVKQERCETWISSVGISAPTSSITDVTVNASTSTLCDNRMLEDKITISVNSKSDNMKCKYTNQKDDIAKLPLSDTLKSSSPNLDASQKAIPKDKQALKAVQKSHLPEVNSNMTNVKNGNIQKRVSVEIVPFSQRMKERKYQPISFANRENSSELNKKNSNVLVERKLSDRKMTTKNKELDKSNNRHSFSGSLTSDIKKEVEPNLGKKVSKPEKLPVQIRIHKSIPKSEIKDKVCSDIINPKEVKNTSETDISGEIKFKMHSTKANQNDLKFMKEEKKTYDNSTKWDVKIQPAPTLANVSSYISNSEGNVSPVMPQTNLQLRNESPKPPQLSESECKDFQFNEESESQNKSQENSWRQQKEVPTLITDDPEPELLRVFARRSIKQKHSDKGRPGEKDEKLITDTSSEDSFHLQEENTEMISVCQNSTVIKISEVSKPHITKPDLKKKSKSFCEKGKVTPRSVSPLKEINLIRRESPLKFSPADPPSCNDTIHPRQRLASVPDVPLNLPPDNDKKNTPRISQTESSSEIHAPSSVKEEPQQRSSSVIVPSPTTSMNGSLTSTGLVKENQEILTGKEAHAPAWLQLAQQRRELREQRERLLLGGSPNSFID